MSIRPNYAELDATKTPTAIDIAWAAGIFEGEGSVRMTGRNKRAIMAQVVQKDPELLYRPRDWFGGSVCGPNTNNVHVWNVCGDRSRIFIALIYKFLTVRRRGQVDATTVLEFLQGTSPKQSMEALKTRLISFTDSIRANESDTRKHRYRARKSEDPNYLRYLNARNAANRKKKVDSNVLKFEETA